MKKTKKVKIVAYPKKYAMGGSGASAIQAEREEVFMLPDFQVVDTAATKKHKDMDDEEITDILPPEGFVFSNSKKNLLSLKSIEDLKVTPDVSIYKEGKSTKLESIKLIDFLPKGKKEITYADAARSIANKVKLVDLEDKGRNGYNRSTNEYNRQMRSLLLGTLAGLQETTKAEKGLANDGSSIPEYETGGYADIISDYKNKLDAYETYIESNYNKGVADYNSLYNKMNLLNTASLAANTLFTGAQQTRVDPAYLDSSMADSMYKGISPAALTQQLESRRGMVHSLADQYLRAGVDPSKVNALMSPLAGKLIESESDVGFKNLQYQADLDQQKARFRNEILNKNIQEGAEAERTTVDNSNKAIAIVGKGVDSFIDNLGKGFAGRVNALRQALSEYNTNKINTLMSKFNLDLSGAEYGMRSKEMEERKRQFDEAMKSGANVNIGTDPGVTGSKSIGSAFPPIVDYATYTSPKGSAAAPIFNENDTVNSSVASQSGANPAIDRANRYMAMQQELAGLYSKANSSKDADDYIAFLDRLRKYVTPERYAELEKNNFPGLQISASSLAVPGFNKGSFPTIYMGDNPIIDFDEFK